MYLRMSIEELIASLSRVWGLCFCDGIVSICFGQRGPTLGLRRELSLVKNDSQQSGVFKMRTKRADLLSLDNGFPTNVKPCLDSLPPPVALWHPLLPFLRIVDPGENHPIIHES